MSGTDPTASQWAEADRWFARADEDRAVAGMAIAAMPPLLDPAVYHCQQAIEKLLKGLLVARALAAPRTHDLAYLGSLVAPHFPSLDLASLITLSAWGVMTRYPMPEAIVGPDIGDIAQALSDIDGLRAGIQTLRDNPAP